MLTSALNARTAVPMTGAEGANQPVNVFEKDGVVMISEVNGSSHELANEHCRDCMRGFAVLQEAAERGKDNGLFALAVEQTKQREKILGQVAKPGQGPLQGLTSTGRLPESQSPAERSANRMGEDSVQFSRSAMVRATGAEVAVQTTETAERVDGSSEADGEKALRTSETGSVEAGEGREDPGQDHAKGDGHGHDERKKSKAKASGERELSESEAQQVEDLRRRDAEVRAHEQAHKSAGGHHAGAVSLSYKTGPDGQRYAVSGEVPVDISPVRGDPQATIQKMQTIKRAALAPAQPSSADRNVAARASQYANEARVELAQEKKELTNPLKQKKTEEEEPTSSGSEAHAVGQAEESSAAMAPSSTSNDPRSKDGGTSENQTPVRGVEGAAARQIQGNNPSSASRSSANPQSDTPYPSRSPGVGRRGPITAYGRNGGAAPPQLGPAKLQVFA